MNNSPTVVLDEFCGNLAELVRRFAPTYVFKRPSSYISLPSVTVSEIRLFLDRDKVSSPSIFVTLSFGSFSTLLYAQEFPDSVAGIVLVDPSHPRQTEEVLNVLPQETETTPPAIKEFMRFIRGFGPTWGEGCREVSSVTSLGDIPLIVLAAGRPEMPAELDLQMQEKLVRDRHAQLQEWAKLSTNGEMRVIPNIGHDITRLAPDLVVDAIKEMFLRVQRKTGGTSITRAKRFMEAPKATFQEAPAFLGVEIDENEDVQWAWTHTGKGSYVSGYSVVKKSHCD